MVTTENATNVDNNIPHRYFYTNIATKQNVASHGQVLTHMTFSKPLSVLFNSIFNENISNVYREAHRQRDSKDLEFENWFPGMECIRFRKLTYKIAYHAPYIGKTYSLCEETHQVLQASEDSIILLSTAQTPQVTFGNSFCIVNMYQIKKVSLKESELIVSSKVVFFKPNMLQDLIQRSALDGVKQFVDAIVDQLQGHNIRPSSSHSSSNQSEDRRRPLGPRQDSGTSSIVPSTRLSSGEGSIENVPPIPSRPRPLPRSHSLPISKLPKLKIEVRDKNDNSIKGLDLPESNVQCQPISKRIHKPLPNPLERSDTYPILSSNTYLMPPSRSNLQEHQPLILSDSSPTPTITNASSAVTSSDDSPTPSETSDQTPPSLPLPPDSLTLPKSRRVVPPRHLRYQGVPMPGRWRYFEKDPNKLKAPIPKTLIVGLMITLALSILIYDHSSSNLQMGIHAIHLLFSVCDSVVIFIREVIKNMNTIVLKETSSLVKSSSSSLFSSQSSSEAVIQHAWKWSSFLFSSLFRILIFILRLVFSK